MSNHNGVNHLAEETSERETAELTHQLELSTEEKKAVKTQAATSLSVADLTALSETFGPPSRSTRDILWLIVVVAFAIVMVGSFLTMAISAFYPSTSATGIQIVLTTFSSVVSFLAGLFTPNPMDSRNTPGSDRINS
jgi:nucleoside recognition membrane protein YjiH